MSCNPSAMSPEVVARDSAVLQQSAPGSCGRSSSSTTPKRGFGRHQCLMSAEWPPRGCLRVACQRRRELFPGADVARATAIASASSCRLRSPSPRKIRPLADPESSCPLEFHSRARGTTRAPPAATASSSSMSPVGCPRASSGRSRVQARPAPKARGLVGSRSRPSRGRATSPDRPQARESVAAARSSSAPAGRSDRARQVECLV